MTTDYTRRLLGDVSAPPEAQAQKVEIEDGGVLLTAAEAAHLRYLFADIRTALIDSESEPARDIAGAARYWTQQLDKRRGRC